MKRWVVRESYKEGLDVVSVLLKNRGINEDARTEFLNPLPIAEYIKKLPADFKESLRKAREEIFTAIGKNQPIIVHGDYDADGICATAILYKTLTQTLGYSKVAYFIPNRFDHGYGLSLESVKEISKLVAKRFTASAGLVITVDCGITAEPQAIKSVRDMGFRLIITDHHQKREQEPQADILLWNDGLVGAGVALVLSIILGLKDEHLVSLAGIATVTDLISLKGFNRALVKKSLQILNSTPPAGIKKLVEISGRSSGEISVYDMGYIIGPRLNASGRLDSALASLQLLLEDNPEELTRIAHKLNMINLERQEMTQKMYDFADGLYSQKRNLHEDDGSDIAKDRVIVVASKELHEGVIGLVAGKLAQKYYKPTIAVSINGDMVKGSARSILGVNIIELLRHFEDRFISLGGHPMAAGFSVIKDNLDQFTADFLTYAQETISPDLLVPQLTIDLELPLSFVTMDLLNQINQLRPYGISNPEPLFLSRKVGVAGSDLVGRDSNHLSLKLFDGQTTYKAMIFDAKNLGILGFDLGTKIDVVYTASLKEFNSKTSVDLVIRDFCLLD